MKLRRTAFLAISALGTSGCGPGIADGCTGILSTYYLCDDGGQGISIERRTGIAKFSRIVEPRVDQVQVEGHTIAIARRPLKVVYQPDGSADWQSNGSCEYLLLDVESGALRQVNAGEREARALHCELP